MVRWSSHDRILDSRVVATAIMTGLMLITYKKPGCVSSGRVAELGRKEVEGAAVGSGGRDEVLWRAYRR